MVASLHDEYFYWVKLNGEVKKWTRIDCPTGYSGALLFALMG